MRATVSFFSFWKMSAQQQGQEELDRINALLNSFKVTTSKEVEIVQILRDAGT